MRTFTRLLKDIFAVAFFAAAAVLIWLAAVTLAVSPYLIIIGFIWYLFG